MNADAYLFYRQSYGDSHNLVTVVMAELDLEVQEALDWIGRLHDDFANQFLELYNSLPLLICESNAVNLQISYYADALGNWVRANDQWSFEVCNPRVQVALLVFYTQMADRIAE